MLNGCVRDPATSSTTAAQLLSRALLDGIRLRPEIRANPPSGLSPPTRRRRKLKLNLFALLELGRPRRDAVEEK